MKPEKNLTYFLISLVATLIVVRLYLFFFPFSNFNLGPYNVHHLFTGAFLLVITVILLLFNIVNKYVIVFTGFSSALILDELIYLIATDGSDLAYLTSTSLLGAIIATIIVLIITGGIYYGKKKK